MIRIGPQLAIFLIVAGALRRLGASTSAAARPGKALGAGAWSHGHGGHDHGAEALELSDAKIAAAGIELEKAGPGDLRDSLLLNGILQPNQEALVQVTPRFPGVVREVHKRVGDRSRKGEVLAKVESNQSLTVYELRAPIAGTIIDRQVALGEYVGEQKAAFTIADLSTRVGRFLGLPARSRQGARSATPSSIDPEDGGPPIEAKITYVSPVGSSDTQSALAARRRRQRRDARLRPGLFVTGRLLLSEKPVADRRQVARAADDREPHRRVRALRREVRGARRRARRARPRACRDHCSACSKATSTPPRTASSIKAEIAKGIGSP